MNMTKKQSIDYLKDLWNEVYNEDSDGHVYAEAIDMAIEALSADVVSREKYDKVNDLYLMSIKAMMNKRMMQHITFVQNIIIRFMKTITVPTEKEEAIEERKSTALRA